MGSRILNRDTNKTNLPKRKLVQLINVLFISSHSPKRKLIQKDKNKATLLKRKHT